MGLSNWPYRETGMRGFALYPWWAFCLLRAYKLTAKNMEDMQNVSAQKKWYKRWWAIILYVIVAFIIIGSLGGSPDNTSKVGEVATSPEQQQPEMYKIGDQVKRGDTVLTITKVNKSWKSSNQFDTPSNSDNTYVVVTVSMENQGTKDLNLSGFWDFKLEDANGVKRDQSIGGIGLNKLATGSLSPGGKTTGDLIFEAGKDATGKLTLHYQPLLSFGKPAIIELQ